MNQTKRQRVSSAARKRRARGTSLRRRGFDASYSTGDGGYRVKCSQCEALVIQGTACHEQGCPNEVKVSDDLD